MRNIEREMCAAISSRRNWSKDNTQVVVNHNNLQIYLHGNHICTITPYQVWLSDGGYREPRYGCVSSTTVSRINTLMEHLRLPYRLHQMGKINYFAGKEWEGNYTISLVKEPQPQPTDAVLGGNQRQPREGDMVLGGELKQGIVV